MFIRAKSLFLLFLCSCFASCAVQQQPRDEPTGGRLVQAKRDKLLPAPIVVRNDASTSLSCEKARLTVTTSDKAKFTAEGCGRRAIYRCNTRGRCWQVSKVILSGDAGP